MFYLVIYTSSNAFPSFYLDCFLNLSTLMSLNSYGQVKILESAKLTCSRADFQVDLAYQTYLITERQTYTNEYSGLHPHRATGVWFMHIFITASFGTYYPALTHSTHLTIVASLKNWAQGDILSGLPFLKHPSLCTCQNWSTIHVPGQKGSVLIERFLCGRVICNFRPATSHVWFLDMFNYRNSKELK